MEKSYVPLVNFHVTAPGHISPFGEGILRKGNNVLCCAVNLRVQLSFKEHDKKVFQLHLENYKHMITYSYEEFNDHLLSHIAPLFKNLPASSYNWETPELINIYKVMPLIIDFVSSITHTKFQDIYHEFILYDFFLIAVGIMCSVNVEFEPFSVFIKSDIPSGIAAGSSSAHSVCIAAAFVHYLRLRALKTGKLNTNISRPMYKISKIKQFTVDTFDANEKNVIFKWSCLSEKLIPRDIYGIGSSVSTYGEIIKFTKGPDEFQPSLRPLTHVRVISILIVDSGEKPDRARLNKELGDFAELFPDIMEPLSMLEDTLSDMSVVLLAASGILLNERRTGELGLGDLLEFDHILYVAMNLTNAVINDLWDVVTKSGFQCKAYGPGLGGCFVVYVPHNVQEQNLQGLKTHLEKKGYKFVETQMNVYGLDVINRRHSNTS